MNLSDSHFPEFDQRFEQMLAQLSPECRKVLVLRDMEGRKYREIARLLKLPEVTIRHRVQQARRELRELLQQESE